MDAEREAETEPNRFGRMKSQPPTVPVGVIDQSGMTSLQGIET